MSMRSKILLYAGLACTVLVLAPATAAAAAPGAPAARVTIDTPPGYVIKTTSNVSLPNNDGTFGKANCPRGTVVLGGGGYIDSGSVATGLNGSFAFGPRTWEVIANNFSGAATTFNVYAVCAKRPKDYKQVTGSLVSNPAGDQDSGTENCPAGDVVLNGGTFGDDPGFSVGMASSYPSGPASWTAAVSNFSGRNSEFEVFAVCAKASAFPHYAQLFTPGSDPAGTQKGIIQECDGRLVVLGGGNQSSNTANLRIEMKTSQPFPATGTSWKSGENNDTGGTTTLTAYAICAT
jgi:hypothetical protein